MLLLLACTGRREGGSTCTHTPRTTWNPKRRSWRAESRSSFCELLDILFLNKIKKTFSLRIMALRFLKDRDENGAVLLGSLGASAQRHAGTDGELVEVKRRRTPLLHVLKYCGDFASFMLASIIQQYLVSSYCCACRTYIHETTSTPVQRKYVPARYISDHMMNGMARFRCLALQDCTYFFCERRRRLIV